MTKLSVSISIPLLFLSLQIIVNNLEIITDLPQLITDTYTFKNEDPLNITIGEYFAIGIPQFDIQNLPTDMKVYEISQEKFMNMFETLEKHTNKDNEIKQEVEGVFQCEIKRPTLEISKTISIFAQKASNSFTSEENFIYVPIRTKQLIYVVDTVSLELSVYHYTGQKMNFLSSVKIGTEKQETRIAMASSSDEEYIYIFSNEAMWAIKTHTVLTSVSKIESFNGFSSVSTRIDKLFHGAYRYLFGLTRLTSVHLIPEPSNPNQNSTTISKYYEQNLIPQDMYEDEGVLYILDLHLGIFMYKLLGTGQIIELDYILWASYGNLEIKVKETNIFVRYLDQQGQKIIEINYDEKRNTSKLVRYYKNDEVIMSMQILTVPVLSPHAKYYRNTPFLFLISTNGELELFPYNTDPRTIRSAHNGVKMHIESLTGIIYLFEDLYLATTTNSIVYVRLRISEPSLQCMIPHSTSHLFYELEFSTNISTCEYYDRGLLHKSLYNYECNLIHSYAIFIDDPELSKAQKILLYGVVLSVVVVFVLGLLGLIRWRNSQLGLIGRIKDEIIRFRDRHRRMQPFTEEEVEGDGKKGIVHFELPGTLPLPHSTEQ